MFISFGSCLFTVISEGFATMHGGDVTRIAAQLVSGIGFLGAGSIVHARGSVVGLTTAATIFVMSSIGMACGAGLYSIAVFSTISLLVGLVVLGRIAVAIALGENDRIREPCDPVVIPQFFDGVTPPALPPGWSSTTWVTSNAGLPSPPADSLPNAALVDDPATISDKQLLSPSIPVIADGSPARMSFRNNFNLQDGFDGGVLEISFDDGLTFQDILAAGGTFTSGGYNGTVSACCGNPLAGLRADADRGAARVPVRDALPLPDRESADRPNRITAPPSRTA